MTVEVMLRGLLWFSAIGCGVMAGVNFAFSGFVMNSLARLEPTSGMAAMQMINRVILRSAFMPLFLGTTLAAGAVSLLGVLSGQGGATVLGGIVYVVGMFVSTILFNVPLNNKLDRSDINGAEGRAFWEFYCRRWRHWNHSRMLASLLAAALFIHALGQGA